MRERELQPELMDDPSQDAGELARSLEDLRGVNRWLGGNAAVLRRLGPLILREGASGPVTLLDVATGSADLPLLLVRWSRRHGVELRVTAIDFHPTTARVARECTAHEAGVRIVQANALELPFATRAFHFAMCCTALHHFTSAEAERVIEEMDRVARAGWLVSDLRRTRAAMLGVRLLAATVWRRHPVTRTDGPRSVAAAFTLAELRRLADAAGAGAAVVRREPLFRLSALLDRRGEVG